MIIVSSCHHSHPLLCQYFVRFSLYSFITFCLFFCDHTMSILYGFVRVYTILSFNLSPQLAKISISGFVRYFLHPVVYFVSILLDVCLSLELISILFPFVYYLLICVYYLVYQQHPWQDFHRLFFEVSRFSHQHSFSVPTEQALS